MKLGQALQNVTRLFLDTAPVIYYVEKNPQYLAVVDAVFNSVDHGTLTAVTSPVTLAECLVVPYRQGLTAAQQDFHDLIVSGRNVLFVPIDHNSAHHAAELRAKYNLMLLDALQIAVAINARCEAMLTNDVRMRRVTEVRVLVVADLEA